MRHRCYADMWHIRKIGAYIWAPIFRVCHMSAYHVCLINVLFGYICTVWCDIKVCAHMWHILSRKNSVFSQNSHFKQKKGGTFGIFSNLFFQKSVKICFFLHKMCHMCAHTFISHRGMQIYPKSTFMRHT